MKRTLASSPLLVLAALALAAAQAPPRPAQAGMAAPTSWTGCCGLATWAEPGPLTMKPSARAGPLARGYAYLVGGSSLRHHLGVRGEIPAKYKSLSNPLAATPQNAQRGAAIYERACASCHGAAGVAEGPGARDLDPPPAHLGWLVKIPPKRRDGFLYWSVAEGGTPFKTDMPAYNGKLTNEEIWSVVGYIQARLPAAKPAG